MPVLSHRTRNNLPSKSSGFAHPDGSNQSQHDNVDAVNSLNTSRCSLIFYIICHPNFFSHVKFNKLDKKELKCGSEQCLTCRKNKIHSEIFVTDTLEDVYLNNKMHDKNTADDLIYFNKECCGSLLSSIGLNFGQVKFLIDQSYNWWEMPSSTALTNFDEYTRSSGAIFFVLHTRQTLEDFSAKNIFPYTKFVKNIDETGLHISNESLKSIWFKSENANRFLRIQSCKKNTCSQNGLNNFDIKKLQNTDNSNSESVFVKNIRPLFDWVTGGISGMFGFKNVQSSTGGCQNIFKVAKKNYIHKNQEKTSTYVLDKDFIDTLDKWILSEDVNHDSSQNIPNTFTKIDFDSLIQRYLACNGNKIDTISSSGNIYKLQKEDFDDAIISLTASYSENLKTVVDSLKNNNIIKKCVKMYLYALDFDENGSYCKQGVVWKNVVQNLFLCAVGKKIFEEKIISNIKNELDEFSTKFNEQFTTEKTGCKILIGKKNLQDCQKYFFNPCLKKIFKNSKFIKIEIDLLTNYKEINKKEFTYEEAIKLNNEHSLRIIPHNINLDINDLMFLMFSSFSLSYSEALFSQGFTIKPKINNHKDFHQLTSNLEKKLSHYGIEFPSSLYDKIDKFFMAFPVITNEKLQTSFDYFLISTSLIRGFDINPFGICCLSCLKECQLAEDLIISYENLKSRLGAHFSKYCQYKEIERYLNVNVELTQICHESSFGESEIRWYPIYSKKKT
ncbi:hypothetical protein EDEG_00256 [Edhazardia aedis USNM 41457]|uniref:Uncharacterized protein n=1 Tax=Edhazardia aedis (strain USNM 41457) TaxID=1003232 RepID=J9D5I4_EDHAE|nr:hypothetical protein EDEG_00256 [Edhazardia aedis USNM 41457]|eukprot:EJW02799.1 hypothetical protein EDEG_00256 [Edhazardia aedis USNM 41457]